MTRWQIASTVSRHLRAPSWPVILAAVMLGGCGGALAVWHILPTLPVLP